MEEIKIEIDRLKAEANSLKCKIVGFSEYGRWPSDDEFSEIGTFSLSLKVISEQIKTLEDVYHAIAANTQ